MRRPFGGIAKAPWSVRTVRGLKAGLILFFEQIAIEIDSGFLFGIPKAVYAILEIEPVQHTDVISITDDSDIEILGRGEETLANVGDYSRSLPAPKGGGKTWRPSLVSLAGTAPIDRLGYQRRGWANSLQGSRHFGLRAS
jgi:hypothetical protein